MVKNVLFIDSGNTSIKTSDYYLPVAKDLEHLENSLDLSCYDKIVLSDVAGRVKGFEVIAKKNSLELIEVSVIDNFLGLSLAYPDVQTLGVDRWLNMLAVLGSIDKRDVLIADIGTAFKLDLVSAESRHIGGSISPGLRLSNIALSQNAENLQEVSIEFSGELGKSTSSCINYGLVMSIVGLLEKTIQSIGSNSRVVLTGGDAEIIAPFIQHSIERESNLVLKGLKAYTKAIVEIKASL